MLRSLRQAMYQVENHGHFGLGYEAYTHFTSPIRRYPDLLVHRAIRSVVRGTEPSTHVRRVDTAKAIPKKFIYPYTASDMVVFGEQCSRTERRADEATRDVVSWLKCEYLRDQVGAVYDGHVSAVTSFGLFVELNDLYVEGLIHITSLPHDYYRFEPAQQRLVGERTRKVFGLGDELVVRVVRVDLDNRKIDFELESANAVRRPKSAIKPKVEKRGKKAGGAKASSNKSTETKKTTAKNAASAKSGANVKATKAKTAKKEAAKTKAAKTSNNTNAKPVKAAPAENTHVQKSAPAKTLATTQVSAEKPVQIEKQTTVAKKPSAAKKAPAGKAPVGKKAAAAKSSSTAKKAPVPKSTNTKTKGEVDHGRKTAKTASKASSAAVQPSAPKTTKSKAVSGVAKTSAKKPVAKVKTTE
jgi:ribonuclease R